MTIFIIENIRVVVVVKTNIRYNQSVNKLVDVPFSKKKKNVGGCTLSSATLNTAYAKLFSGCITT